MSRRTIWACGLLAALALPALAADRRIREEYTLAAGQDLRFDFPVGDLHFIGTDGDRVEVELDIHCKQSSSRCLDSMEEIELVARRSERRLTLEVDRHPKWLWDSLELEGEVRLPAERALTVDMGVGQLEIDDVAADLTVDMSVGEVWIKMPAEAVRAVHLDVGVGDAEAEFPDSWVEGRRSLLVGAEVTWDDGPGAARVDVDLGVGDVKARFD